MIAANLLAGFYLGRCVGVNDADVMNSRQFLRTSEDRELDHLHTDSCVYLRCILSDLIKFSSRADVASTLQSHICCYMLTLAPSDVFHRKNTFLRS